MSHDADIHKLAELIKGINIAMLTTVGDNGALHSRPMATQQAEFDGVLWFFTEAESGKVHEVQQDKHVNLSYADPSGNRFVSVSGLAQLVRDRAKAEELWSPIHKAWFPKGLDDPNLALLRVQVTQAEYWDGPSSTLVKLYGFAKAMVTGKKYGEEGVDHAKVDLRSGMPSA
ncbi:MAG TPA: pyridoxamine 5'-phosphate oxidase family protein [Tepidisphaeraceae bacterium]|nr:pyridoxamine 5'-phosphate oxidase family protein [Tepidisphaeraceae bacterium]